MSTLIDSDGTDNLGGISYPYMPLHLAIKVADAIKELGGARAAVSRSSLAGRMGEGDKSAVFQQRIKAAKVFGMIDGRSEFVLTPLSKRYYFPTSDSDKPNALLEMFGSPASFAEIIRRFDGDKLPSPELIGNMVSQECGVPDSWKERTARFFYKSAQFVGAIDQAGYLRVKAAKKTHLATEAAVDTHTKPEVALTPAPSVPLSNGVELPYAEGCHNYVLPLPKNRKVLIQAPLDITAAEIKRLQRWIEFTLQVDWSGEEKEENKDD